MKASVFVSVIFLSVCGRELKKESVLVNLLRSRTRSEEDSSKKSPVFVCSLGCFFPFCLKMTDLSFLAALSFASSPSTDC